MPWDDDFLDELQSSTGLAPGQLVDVILSLPQNAAERQRREREDAARRARALLLEHLDDEQRAAFEDRSRFYVNGSHGGRYCVHLGRQHNIFPVDQQGVHLGRNICVHVRDAVPDEDNVLAQTLLIQSNEAELLRIANRG